MSGWQLAYYEPFFRRLLALGPFERRAQGWRFGTRRISDKVVLRLIASGHARRDGDRIFKALPAPIGIAPE